MQQQACHLSLSSADGCAMDGGCVMDVLMDVAWMPAKCHAGAILTPVQLLPVETFKWDGDIREMWVE